MEYSIPSLVWFGRLLDPIKFNYFSKLSQRKSRNFRVKYLLFVGKLDKPFFLHYNLHTTGSLGYRFGSLWTTPWPDEKYIFLKFVICEIRKFPYEILTFFLGKLLPKFFFILDSRCPWDAPYPVWFDLNNSLTRWKRHIFKIRYLRNS